MCISPTLKISNVDELLLTTWHPTSYKERKTQGIIERIGNKILYLNWLICGSSCNEKNRKISFKRTLE
jgi:hypothetical protein